MGGTQPHSKYLPLRFLFMKKLFYFKIEEFNSVLNFSLTKNIKKLISKTFPKYCYRHSH